MLRLREVCSEDCALLFAWANDPDARRHSLRPEPIDWHTHVAWFERKRRDVNCLLLLAFEEAEAERGEEGLESVAVGQIRFDIDGSEAEVGISLAREQRGKGRSAPLIELGVQTLFQRTRARTAHAWIKPDNLASQRAFTGAGFYYQGMQTRAGISLQHYTRLRCNYP